MEALWLKHQGLPVVNHSFSRFSPNKLRAYLSQLAALTHSICSITAHRKVSCWLIRPQLKTIFGQIQQLRQRQKSTNSPVFNAVSRLRVFFKNIGIEFRKVGHIPAEADVEAQEDFKKKSCNRAYGFGVFKFSAQTNCCILYKVELRVRDL